MLLWINTIRVGANTYELINKLFSASELDAASFDDVTGKLDERFKQSLNELTLAASYTLYQCKMKPDQTYGDWVADIRCIGRECNFGASEVLDRLIRDMIVLNTPHNEVRRACLRESSPTLEMVLKIANSTSHWLLELRSSKGQLRGLHRKCLL